MCRLRLQFIVLGAACSGFAWPALARAAEPVATSEPAPQPNCARVPRFHADLELDPTAYALAGFSLHAGLGWDSLRFDLGVFGLRVPEFVHRQPDFDVATDGYGVKVQYFPFRLQRGAFVGVDVAYNRSSVRSRTSHLSSARDRQFVVGVNAGFRFLVIGDFYVTPWLGVGYALGADDVSLGSERFEANPLIIFPAVHLGYQLR